MTPKPTPSPADRLRELHAKTTPGEWFTLRDGAYADVKARSDRAPDYPNAVASDIGRREAEFIAAAHNDLPALLSDHARLVEEIGRMRAQAEADRRELDDFRTFLLGAAKQMQARAALSPSHKKGGPST